MQKITIPEISYEVWDINEFLKRTILRKCPRLNAPDAGDAVHSDNNSNNNNDGDDKDGEYLKTRKLQHNELRD